MAPTVPSNKVDPAQTLKAARALLTHLAKVTTQKRLESPKQKKNLLAAGSNGTDDDGVSEELSETPIWLILATKKHILDKTRLKPGKIAIPHPLYSLTTPIALSICLITTDPQRAIKDAVADPSFPSDLRPLITRVISVSKLRARYKSYESRRQIVDEHDIFLADDRIITLLGGILGKAAYKGGKKRPIPVVLGTKKPVDMDQKGKNKEGKGGKKEKADVASPEKIAKEIRATLSSALINLSSSVTTSVRVGFADWEATHVAENVEAVVEGLVEKWVPKKWKGLRSVHVKGPNSAAIPIWETAELWIESEDVLTGEAAAEVKAIEEGKKSKKRKSLDAEIDGEGGPPPKKKAIEKGNAAPPKVEVPSKKAATDPIGLKKPKAKAIAPRAESAKGLPAETNGKPERPKKRKLTTEPAETDPEPLLKKSATKKAVKEDKATKATKDGKSTKTPKEDKSVKGAKEDKPVKAVKKRKATRSNGAVSD